METGEDDFLSRATVAIIGLGLMGGSLAMALRGHCARLLGIDLDPQVLDLARQIQLADDLTLHPETLLPQADVVILATPVGSILRLLDSLPAYHPGSAVVMDLGSTKVEICSKMKTLPERFDPIGGHPMCGKENISLNNAEAGLFKDAVFAVSTLSRSSERAKQLALEIIQVIQARPLWIDPHQHDEWVAATSHMPYLLACALALATPLQAAPLAGSGYRSTARLSATPTGMMSDILATNSENILRALHLLRNQIAAMETLLDQKNTKDLNILLEQAGQHHQTIIQKGKPL